MHTRARVYAWCFSLLIASGMARATEPGSTSPVLAPVDTFQRTLTEIMQEAGTRDRNARYARLAPVIRETFNMPSIVEAASEPYWSRLSPVDRARLTDAFAAYVTALYVDAFDSFEGERFALSRATPPRGDQALVSTQLTVPNSAPGRPDTLRFRYFLQNDGGRWQIEDVALDAISAFQIWRSQFQSILRRQGIDHLIGEISRVTADVLKSPDDPGGPPALASMRLWGPSIVVF